MKRGHNGEILPNGKFRWGNAEVSEESYLRAKAKRDEDDPARHRAGIKAKALAAKNYPTVFAAYSKLYTAGVLSSGYWIRAGGTQEQCDAIYAQAKAETSKPTEPPTQVAVRFRLTPDQKLWLTNVKGKPVRQGPGQTHGRKASKSRGSNFIEKTLTELVKMSDEVFNRRCATCDNPLGCYIWDGEGYQYLSLQHGHVTKTRKQGGTKEDDYPVCSVCQRIQGQLCGRPLSEAQMEAKRIHAERGYRFVTRLIEEIQ